MKVADIRDIHRPSFDPATAITVDALPVRPPFHGVTFVDETRLLLRYGEDRVLAWNSSDRERISDDPLVRGATALHAKGELIASSNFPKRTLGLTVIGSGRVEDEYVLESIEPNQLQGTGREGSALAVGPRGLAALASNQGTFALLELEDQAAKIVLNDTLISDFDKRVIQVTWIDEDAILFAGDLGALPVVRLRLSNSGEQVGVDGVDELTLQQMPTGMQWINYDPLSKLLVYGTKDNVFVGEVRLNCQHTAWGTLFGIPLAVATILGLLLALRT